ncbi:MAG TPA: DUF5946 family protein [Anaerolineales bacterium]|nr:DUF5946 family protein [Anaerolineales bacterium]HRQ92332.1 DUF5946 family protein [Anaerolineales bacterium]
MNDLNCPQCGGKVPEGAQCSDRFWEGQILEGDNPAYYAVHNFSVPTYYLQHNMYSREGWLAVHKLLSEFVFDGLAPEDARQKIARQVDSGNRTFSIVRGEKLLGVEQIAWGLTIADVRLDTAEHYCADVRRWARQVCKDGAALAAASSN